MPANRYTLSNGTLVPGCTTICNQLDKPALIDWAWRLGTENKPWREERDKKGNTGTLIHEAILGFLTGEEVALRKEDEERFGKFYDWWEKETHGDILDVICEQPLVSEKCGFGGQPDIYITTTDKLIDIKTGGKWVYDEWWYQLAGYDILLREHGYKPKEYQILWLPESGFEAPIRTSLKNEEIVFRHLLGIYYARRAP